MIDGIWWSIRNITCVSTADLFIRGVVRCVCRSHESHRSIVDSSSAVLLTEVVLEKLLCAPVASSSKACSIGNRIHLFSSDSSCNWSHYGLDSSNRRIFFPFLLHCNKIAIRTWFIYHDHFIFVNNIICRWRAAAHSEFVERTIFAQQNVWKLIYVTVNLRQNKLRSQIFSYHNMIDYWLSTAILNESTAISNESTAILN